MAWDDGGKPYPCPKCGVLLGPVERICSSCGHDMRSKGPGNAPRVIGGCVSAVVGLLIGLFIVLRLVHYVGWDGPAGLQAALLIGGILGAGIGWAVGFFASRHWGD